MDARTAADMTAVGGGPDGCADGNADGGADGGAKSCAEHRRDRGASTVELALYMPLLLFVIFVTVQVALLFLGNQAASAAAREAARVARTGGGTGEAIGAAQVRGRTYAASVGHGLIEDVSVQVAPAGGDEIRAVVRAKGIQLVPGVPGVRIRQVVQGPVEEFRPDL